MKKNRILSLLLICLAVVLVFSACGKDDAQPSTGGSAKQPKMTIDPNAVVSLSDASELVGTWLTTPIDFTDEINKQLEAELSDDTLQYFHIDNYSYCLTFTFTPEGNFAMQPDTASVEALVDNIKAGLNKSLAQMYTDLAESQGAKVEDVVDAIGYESLDALVEYTLTAFDFEQIKFDIIAPLNISGTYGVDDGKVVLISSGMEGTTAAAYEACFKSGRLFLIPPEDIDQQALFNQTLTLVKQEK